MNWLRTAQAETFGWTLVHSIWELAVTAAIVLVMLMLLRRRSANLRYLVACAGLVAMAAAPIATFICLLPPSPQAMPALVIDQPSVPLAAAERMLIIDHGQPMRLSPEPMAVAAPPLTRAERITQWVRPALPYAVALYFIGALLLTIRLVGGYARLWQLTRQSLPAAREVEAMLSDLTRRMKMSRAIKLLESAAVEAPAVLGVLKPVILIPAAAITGLSPQQLTALLAHELAHIRRFDYLANLAQSVIDTLLFYHPAVWWLSVRIRQEREHCCDDFAVAIMGNPIEYATALASMESLRSLPTLAPAKFALSARGGALLPRIRRLLGISPKTRPVCAISAAVATLLMLCTLIYVGCSKPTEQAGTPPSGPTTSASSTQTAATSPADQILSAENVKGDAPAAENRIDAPKSAASKTENSAVTSPIAIDSRILLVSANFQDDFRIGWDSTMLVGTGEPATSRPAKVVHATIIDKWTLNLLTQASKVDKKGYSAQLPSLYMQNGKNAELHLREKEPMGNGDTPIDLHETIWLESTISKDRRYVVFVMTPPLPGDSVSDEDRKSPMTMVSIPDGGTLLIDGGDEPDAGAEPAASQPAGTKPRHVLILIQPTIVNRNAAGDSDGSPRDIALTQYNEAQHLCDEAINASTPQWEKASAYAQEAIDVIQNNKGLFSDIETDALTKAAQRQLQSVAKRREAWAAAQEIKAAALTQPSAPEAANPTSEEKRKEVAQLIADAHRLYDVFQFNEAADLLRQATVLDPQDENARLFLRLVESKITARQNRNPAQGNDPETIRMNPRTEDMIPYADLMIHPDNWLEVTQNRAAGTDESQGSAANHLTNSKLDQPLKEITADKQGLEKVINFLRDNTNANVFVNWKALEAAGIKRDSPVSVNLKDISFRKALTAILAGVGAPGTKLAFEVDDGIISISTKDDLESAKHQIVRVYDIRDLLINVPDRTSAGGLFDEPEKPNDAPVITAEARRAQNIKSIEDTIQATVAPDSWRDKGGKIGSIRELNGQLIVNQTVDNQDQIKRLLLQLLDARSVQIAIEAKLVLVDDDIVNSLPKPQTKPPAASGAATAPATTAVGLDDKQLTQLLAKIDASSTASVLTEPRVTLFNGQHGFIAMTQQQNYIADCKTKIDEHGKIVPDMAIKTLTYGTTLDLGATTSADRKNVVLDLKPMIRQLIGIDTFPAPGAPAAPEFFIQKPLVKEATMSMMCSVPDGQTMVLTGLKLSGELGTTTAPASRAIYAKHPPAPAKERQLLIIVRPKIIVNHEIKTDQTFDKPTGLPASPGGRGGLRSVQPPTFVVHREIEGEQIFDEPKDIAPRQSLPASTTAPGDK